MEKNSILEIKGLNVSFSTYGGRVKAVRDVSLEIGEGECVAIVGESGCGKSGMRQRVMIAIAMCCNPKLLIADEPTTALDVTIQAQILELMQELQKKFNTSIILITHDLGVVANMAERVLVFYAGKVVENGPTRSVFYQPRHPYTRGLLKSMPKLNAEGKEELVSIEGAPPDLFAPPEGCAFAARCEYAMNICHKQQPPFIGVGENHCAACWLNMKEVPDKLRPAWMKSEHVTLDDIK